METKGEGPLVSFIDNPHAPEIFASEAVGFIINNGVVRITFASARANHSTDPVAVNRVVIARLAIPVPAAQGLAIELFDFLKKQGLDPGIAPPKAMMQ